MNVNLRKWGGGVLERLHPPSLNIFENESDTFPSVGFIRPTPTFNLYSPFFFFETRLSQQWKRFHFDRPIRMKTLTTWVWPLICNRNPKLSFQSRISWHDLLSVVIHKQPDVTRSLERGPGSFSSWLCEPT